jgi:hypothetical protein
MLASQWTIAGAGSSSPAMQHMSVAGPQGVNTGMRDAVNLA